MCCGKTSLHGTVETGTLVVMSGSGASAQAAGGPLGMVVPELLPVMVSALKCPAKVCMCERVCREWRQVLRDGCADDDVWRRLWLDRNWAAPGAPLPRP